MGSIPVVDIGPLRDGDGRAVGAAIGAACREHGFFHITGHGVDDGLQADLERHSRAFFAQPLATKLRVAMPLAGSAWRGYFPPGGELTSGVPDLKEGYYFGQELPVDPRPLHGPNLFPQEPSGLRETVLAYMDALTDLGQVVLRGIALSLDLDATYFEDRFTASPLTLFRIFHYPAQPAGTAGWGVGEHTDYGLLTILKQDHNGGLEVRAPAGWVSVDPIPGTFVCNIGDMLDRLTGGTYRSTPHRVRSGARDRLSWPFFFDPAFDADVTPVADAVLADGPRWDGVSPHEFRGTYGDYLLHKVGKVFPDLNEGLPD
ncbi:2-oxoglutarate and iron-dependent oxygenase domain-containing protein [Actinokineospora auranticolor]|uniref:Isopenicillin N synthase-like dioxygenase n=1 Tax=Actinokineospora auranticolor TaxID=155976 RepID=A0A2S6H0I1_9PSEU|nr:2-oxoglutarate and iron-dependent oxygenase domain-containing protein [Actinokineospora auranticolor]PPK70989.1 isopenicillin N synthase-like dioxygenase [Actinokineospora auranticolor]